MGTEYRNMDFNYNDDDAADTAGTDGANGGGDGDYQKHQSLTNNNENNSGNMLPAPLETETGRQLSNLSMPKKKSSILGASSNLVNSIVGELYQLHNMNLYYRLGYTFLIILCTSYAHAHLCNFLFRFNILQALASLVFHMHYECQDYGRAYFS